MKFSFLFSIDNDFVRKCGIQTNVLIEDWAIELDLNGPFALSSGVSTVSFVIDGKKANDKQGDMLLSHFVVYLSPFVSLWSMSSDFQISMGFGDGEKYISFLMDFDGMSTMTYLTVNAMYSSFHHSLYEQVV